MALQSGKRCRVWGKVKLPPRRRKRLRRDSRTSMSSSVPFVCGILWAPFWPAYRALAISIDLIAIESFSYLFSALAHPPCLNNCTRNVTCRSIFLFALAFVSSPCHHVKLRCSSIPANQWPISHCLTRTKPTRHESPCFATTRSLHPPMRAADRPSKGQHGSGSVTCNF
ncbi:hypothetical protein BDV97DRAFT_220301 [Delphinella strobiligena]|nr:hypothetical protein BDV97DRAFT_220301 [Delphinella strobiligena]